MGPNAGKELNDNAWQDSRISKTGAFATYHGHRSNLEIVASGRIELNQSKAYDLSPEYLRLYEDSKITQFNPGASLGFIRHLEDAIAIGLWMGRTQRSASITERHIYYFPVGQDPYEMVGNPNLKPEVNNQIDFTFEIRTATSKINFDAFSAYLQNYISSEIKNELSPGLPNSPGVRQFINLKNALSTGFKISYSQDLSARIRHSAQIAYTYAKRLDIQDPLPEIAPLDVTLRSFWQLKKATHSSFYTIEVCA
ncbi:MAG: TonB-dependent receptor [Saprospiraceae bacterium]|nr:TonB-dependent receptor [Saprospiraceae bacterium]